MEAQSEAVERALWVAVRLLEESASVSRHIAQKDDALGLQLLNQAAERDRHARLLRGLPGEAA